jgi:DNA-binding transcriptional ArsR family regulator
MVLNKKIGKDIISFTPANQDALFTDNTKKTIDQKKQILEILGESKRPLNITELTKLSKLSWRGVKSTLVDLTVTGQVEGFRSGRAFLFRLKQDLKCELKTCNEKAAGFYEIEGFRSGHFLCEGHAKKVAEKNLLLQSTKNDSR